MIIVCPCGEKKFEIDSNLIPEKGRLLKCGSCDETWFFNKNHQASISKEINIKPIKKRNKESSFKSLDKKSETINGDLSGLSIKKGSELVKYQPKFYFSFGKLLNYLVVLIISFVALIIVLDTFKNPLSNFFPNIELILYNLFETLKDLVLFIKDLN